MAGLFNPPSLPTVPPPPPAPTLDTPSVQQAASDEQKKRGMAQGRASTYLTDPATQTKAEKTQQRYLGANP